MFRAVCVCIIAVGVVSGCASGPFAKDRNSDPLMDQGSSEAFEVSGVIPASETRFPDVPLPAKLKEDVERTFVYESRSLQIGRMVYTSKWPLNELAQFYIKESPKFNWTLVSVLQADGIILTFEKPGKRMMVLLRESRILRGGSQLIINLTPDEGSNPVRVSTAPL